MSSAAFEIDFVGTTFDFLLAWSILDDCIFLYRLLFFLGLLLVFTLPHRFPTPSSLIRSPCAACHVRPGYLQSKTRTKRHL